MQSLMRKLFDQLRTKETLGYSVNCAFDATHEVLGYRVVVERVPPAAFGPAAWLRFTVARDAENMDDESYAKTRQSV